MSLHVGTNRLYPEGTPRGARTMTRCNTCREWYPARAALCPDCRTEKPKFNKGLRVAMLNTNRHRQLEHARKTGEL